jgi:polyadenylate-binding protein-interacting protein 1
MDVNDRGGVDEEHKKKFNFSANAAPFVPKTFAADSNTATDDNNVALGKNAPTLSVDAPEFYPRSYVPRIEEITTAPAVDVVADIQWAIQVLTVNPANFDDVMSSLTSLAVLAENLLDNMMLGAVVDEIFNSSVNEKNFRYTGARMCGHLMAHLQPAFGARFQNFLIARCCRERDVLAVALSSDNLPRLIGFTLFLGELLVNTKDIQTGSVIAELPICIMQLLFWLLHFLSDASAVCIVQIFKLTGPILEQHVPNMDDMCGRIMGVGCDPRTPQHIRAMFMNVMQLRSSNWGRNLADSVATPSTVVQQTQYPAYVNGNEPFFFDENALCDEFECMSNFTDSDEGISPTGMPAEYWAGDEVMDPEMAAAFEVFLAESGPPQPTAHTRATYCNGGGTSFQP